MEPVISKLHHLSKIHWVLEFGALILYGLIGLPGSGMQCSSHGSFRNLLCVVPLVHAGPDVHQLKEDQLHGGLGASTN